MISIGFRRSAACKLLDREYLYYFVAKQELEDEIKDAGLFIYHSVCRKLIKSLDFGTGLLKYHAFACSEDIVTVVMGRLLGFKVRFLESW